MGNIGNIEKTAMTTMPTSCSKDAALPQTLYRSHVVACDNPENFYTFEFMADYLTMMALLERSIAGTLGESCGVTLLQYRILLRLHDDGAQQVTALARRLSTRLSTVSSAAGGLAERGFVSRLEDPDDMRTVELHLADKGHAALERADDEVASMLAKHWQNLTREQLKAALTSSIAAVERHSSPRMENGRVRFDTALVDTVCISRALTTKALQAHGLTVNDFRTALAVRIRQNGTTATEAARFLFLNSCDITPCLKHLEAAGIVTRERSQTNRRVRRISLTKKGALRIAELMPVVFDALHETCHSDDALIAVHISAARDLVARKRRRLE